MTGFHSWGQWHRRDDTGDHRWHNQPHPNHHVQFLGVQMLDGNGSPHAGVPMVPASNFKEGVQSFLEKRPAAFRGLDRSNPVVARTEQLLGKL